MCEQYNIKHGSWLSILLSNKIIIYEYILLDYQKLFFTVLP